MLRFSLLLLTSALAAPETLDSDETNGPLPPLLETAGLRGRLNALMEAAKGLFPVVPAPEDPIDNEGEAESSPFRINEQGEFEVTSSDVDSEGVDFQEVIAELVEAGKEALESSAAKQEREEALLRAQLAEDAARVALQNAVALRASLQEAQQLAGDLQKKNEKLEQEFEDFKATCDNQKTCFQIVKERGTARAEELWEQGNEAMASCDMEKLMEDAQKIEAGEATEDAPEVLRTTLQDAADRLSAQVNQAWASCDMEKLMEDAQKIEAGKATEDSPDCLKAAVENGFEWLTAQVNQAWASCDMEKLMEDAQKIEAGEATEDSPACLKAVLQEGLKGIMEREGALL